EIRASRVVMQHVIWWDQILRSIARHKFTSDAIYPRIRVQANLVRPASPGVADADDVETHDRLLLPIVVNRAEQTQLRAATPRLEAELDVEILAQMRVSIQTKYDYLL